MFKVNPLFSQQYTYKFKLDLPFSIINISYTYTYNIIVENISYWGIKQKLWVLYTAI